MDRKTIDDYKQKACKYCAESKYERMVSGEIKLTCEGQIKNGFEKCEEWKDEEKT